MRVPYGKTHVVNQAFERRLDALTATGNDLLSGGLKGIEKESLRVDDSGHLACTPHPAGLGSALTNRYVTTDFSEALLEFVTPAACTTWEALRELCDVHQFTYSQLGDELLWPASMPCRIPPDESIPLARYGESNIGRMKTIYRRGLGYRYGRAMQTIAGVHFNYSLPASFWSAYRELLRDERSEQELRSDLYLGLVRNFRRFGWLVLYLFGASPALCKSFSAGNRVSMPSLNDETYFEPYGTSLRMSDLGYNNQTQAGISISLNSLDEYIRDLGDAIRTPEPAYEKIGVKVDGVYRQLSANKLQIENEFYSPIRPKRVARSGERPTAALRRGGIEYVEVRSLDINVFDPAGINQNTMRFMESFLIYCLIEESPAFDELRLAEVVGNQRDVAARGRMPGLELLRNGERVLLVDWARDIVGRVAAVAEAIDREEGGSSYRDAARLMEALVDDPGETPSARMLAELQQADCGFFDFALDVAHSHKRYFSTIESLRADRLREFEQEAQASLQRQHSVETADDVDFDEFLARYFATD